MDAKYSGKVCVVTGAASGIGRAMAIDLANQGAILALSDVNEAGLNETRELIGDKGSNQIRVDVLDVADADAVSAYAETVKESLGDADYVMNIAGLTRIGTFEETSLESFEKVMDVNFWGVVRMSKAFLPQLVATKGALVNISSVFGLIGFEGQSHYCASKFAVRGFSETIAAELEEKGVRVVSVHPGGVATNIARNAQVDKMPDGQEKGDFEQRFDEVAKTTPADAAQTILNGAAAGKRRVLIGGDARFISFVQRLFPTNYFRIIRNFFGAEASS